ncbi:glycolate oxidase subunit GlcE [Marinobacter caseinilyticus]|uniref:glycolate oxidase subunit GlcE n=1 Tax=Marinobacter caseinilyticus TaxID=2692195 RepID=UPI00140828CA|nr:glycolate oxidase subunit GlcE [Marinobacter caseinilyticus]
MPDITEQLQDQIKTARTEARKLSIVGGGSKAFMGRAIDADRLDVSGHSGIVTYQPVELVLTVRAGTPLLEIEAALAKNNQMLSFEPPHFSDASTIGGTLACNQSGPGRPWWSSVRDQVLGVGLINGTGEKLRFGGQVMKNVAGYDVSRTQAGAMGSLGVLTEISLKVLPRPATTVTLSREMRQNEAILFMNARAAEPKPLSAACWLDGKLYLRLSGAQSAVEATAKQWDIPLMTGGDEFWQQLRDQQLPFFAGDQPLWRFSVNSTAPNPPLDGPWLIDWAGSQRWYRGDAELASMEAHAEKAGGQVSLFRGGDRTGEVMHRQLPALQAIQKRLKHSFDPDGLFNPGRLYSWM